MRGRRLAYFCLGWVLFSVGAVGAVLPLLPTTPFMILALAAFSQSSQRFHDWLYHHRVFGPPLRRWRRHRVIPLGVKLTAYAAMLASLAYLALVADAGWELVSLSAAVLLGCVFFISRFPSRPPS